MRFPSTSLVELSDQVVVVIVRVDDVHLNRVRVRDTASGIILEEVDLLRSIALDGVSDPHPEVVAGDDDPVGVFLVGQHLWKDDVVDKAARIATHPVRGVVEGELFLSPDEGKGDGSAVDRHDAIWRGEKVSEEGGGREPDLERTFVENVDLR